MPLGILNADLGPFDSGLHDAGAQLHHDRPRVVLAHARALREHLLDFWYHALELHDAGLGLCQFGLLRFRPQFALLGLLPVSSGPFAPELLHFATITLPHRFRLLFSAPMPCRAANLAFGQHTPGLVFVFEVMCKDGKRRAGVGPSPLGLPVAFPKAWPLGAHLSFAGKVPP